MGQTIKIHSLCSKGYFIAMSRKESLVLRNSDPNNMADGIACAGWLSTSLNIQGKTKDILSILMLAQCTPVVNRIRAKK